MPIRTDVSAAGVYPLPALTANPEAAPAGGEGAAEGAWSSAEDRDAAIATINALRTRVAEIEAALQAAGIIE